MLSTSLRKPIFCFSPVVRQASQVNWPSTRPAIEPRETGPGGAQRCCDGKLDSPRAVPYDASWILKQAAPDFSDGGARRCNPGYAMATQTQAQAAFAARMAEKHV